MPSIETASVKVSSFPNVFISPYGNDGVIPLYSSIPIDYSAGEDCLPCVVCGNSSIRSQIIEATGSQISHVSSNDVELTIVPNA